MAYIERTVRSRRRYSASALIALLAMVASTSAAALALPCGPDCPEMAPAAANTSAHACCPGGADTEPDPSTRMERTLPDCCATLGACESEPLLSHDDAELVERFDTSITPPIVAVRTTVPPTSAFAARGPGPAPPPPRLATTTIVLLR